MNNLYHFKKKNLLDRMENRTENRIKFFAKFARGEQREGWAVLTEGVGKGVAGKKF